MVSSSSAVNVIELPVSITRPHCHCDSVSLVWFYSIKEHPTWMFCLFIE